MVVWLIYLSLFSVAFSDFRRKQQEEAIGRNPLDGYNITKFGDECFTSGPIRYPEQIDELNCTIINGDLTFEPEAGAANMTIKTKIKLVRGCIFIEKTPFTNINFIKNANTSCGISNKISDNPNLCISDADQEQLRRHRFHLDVSLNVCPSCVDFSQPGCRTFLFDIDWKTMEEEGEFTPKIIYGRLIIKDMDFPKKPIDSKVILLTGKGPEAALIIKNTSIPIEENIMGIDINTYGNLAITMEAIKGYRFPRHLYLRFQKKLPNKVLEIETEGPDECYLSYNSYEQRNISSILDCKFIYGRFNVITEGYSPVAKWVYLESRENMSLTETPGSDLSRIIAHVKKIDIHDKNIFNVKFEGDVCYKSDVISRLQSMMQKGQKYKVRHNPENCKKYLGFVNGYDLKYDNGASMQEIKGIFYLEPMKKIYEDKCKKKLERGGYYCDNNRFKHLKKIEKPHHMQDDVPALIVEVCADTIKVPDFVFKESLSIKSFRDDDVLIKINGPAYKMEASKYKVLESRYGKKRLDIDPMLDGDCYFKKPIEDLSELDKCERIVGNLIINGTVKNKVSTIIKHISGCIHIVNSNIDSIDFIQLEIPYNIDACLTCYEENPNFTFAIMNNSNLCANEWTFGVDKHRVTNNKPGCGNNISQIAYQTRNYAFYTEFNNTENSYLHEVKELHGRIIFAFTNEETIDVFANLQSIVYLGPGPAILIENNPKLKSLNFSSLRRITVKKGGIALELRNNPELKISDQQNSTFKKATDGRIDVITPEQIEEEEEMSPTWKSFWIAFGAGLGVLAGIAILFAGVIVTVHLVKSRKSKKSGKNMKKNNGKCDKKEKNSKNGKREDKRSDTAEKLKKSAVSPAVKSNDLKK